MSKRIISCLGAMLAIMPALAVQAAAQDSPPNKDRTGPNAAPLAPPSYATPAPELAPGAIAPSDTNTAGGAQVQLEDVVVEPVDAMKTATPQLAWQIAHAAKTGPGLAYAMGEALDADWVKRQFDDFRGKSVGVDDLVARVQTINRAFADNGFVNSGLLIPPQDMDPQHGVLRLRLVEGRLGDEQGNAVKVVWCYARDKKTGDCNNNSSKGLSSKFVLDRMPSAAASPLNVITLERDFRLLSDDPAVRTVNADLKPLGKEGQAGLTLTVAPQPRFDLYLSQANNRSPSIGSERTALGGSVRNLMFDGSILSGEYGVTDGLTDESLAFMTPVFSPRTTFDIRVGVDDAAVVDPSLQLLDIRSTSQSAEIGLKHVFLQRPLTPRADGTWSAARTFNAGATIATKTSTTWLLGMPFSFSPGAVDGRAEVTVLRLGSDYVQKGRDYVLAVSSTASFGLSGTGSDIPNVDIPKPNFSAVRVQVAGAKRVWTSWELRGRLDVQAAGGMLYSSERMSLGGSSSVRGYRENLVLADTAALVSVELGRAFSISGGRRTSNGRDWGAFNAAAFIDAAAAQNMKGPQPDLKALSSVGATVTWTPTPLISARLALAVPLQSVKSNFTRNLQDDGVHFQVTFHPLALFH